MQGHPQRRTGQFCGILSYVLVHFAAAEEEITVCKRDQTELGGYLVGSGVAVFGLTFR
jgi:hypothetical protein